GFSRGWSSGVCSSDLWRRMMLIGANAVIAASMSAAAARGLVTCREAEGSAEGEAICARLRHTAARNHVSKSNTVPHATPGWRHSRRHTREGADAAPQDG